MLCCAARSIISLLDDSNKVISVEWHNEFGLDEVGSEGQLPLYQNIEMLINNLKNVYHMGGSSPMTPLPFLRHCFCTFLCVEVCPQNSICGQEKKLAL